MMRESFTWLELFRRYLLTRNPMQQPTNTRTATPKRTPRTITGTSNGLSDGVAPLNTIAYGIDVVGVVTIHDCQTLLRLCTCNDSKSRTELMNPRWEHIS